MQLKQKIFCFLSNNNSKVNLPSYAKSKGGKMSLLIKDCWKMYLKLKRKIKNQKRCAEDETEIETFAEDYLLQKLLRS